MTLIFSNCCLQVFLDRRSLLVKHFLKIFHQSFQLDLDRDCSLAVLLIKFQSLLLCNKMQYHQEKRILHHQCNLLSIDWENYPGFWCTMGIDYSINDCYLHHHHHHHHLALVARISLTLSRHSSLSFIALGRSSGQHPVSSHSCWMYVRAGRPAFARPCVGIHKSTSLMSSSLLLQQCPACLVRLTWIVFVIGGRWPYSWCLVGCCCQDLFRIARSILV